MKRFLQTAAAALFVAAAFSPAHALVIGTGDTENFLPFGDPTIPVSLYQQVYNSSNFAGLIDITSISFYNSVGNTGGAPRSDTFRIFLSVTSTPVGGVLGFDPSATIVFQGQVPAPANGRLDFTGLPAFHYDPSQGNLLVTIQNFLNGSPASPTPGSPLNLALNFDSNADTMFSINIPGGAGVPATRGLVTGFNDVANPVPVPAVGAAIPLLVAGGGLVGYRRRRKTAKAAA